MATVLTPDLYQGTVYSNPLPWQSGATGVTASALLSDQDANDTAKRLTLGLEVSYDSGMTYQQAAQAAWTGGPNVDHDGHPVVILPSVTTSYTGSEVKPTHARVRLELPATLSVGATLAFAGGKPWR